jgi:hypothetical protein
VPGRQKITASSRGIRKWPAGLNFFVLTGFPYCFSAARVVNDAGPPGAKGRFLFYKLVKLPTFALF